MNKKLLAIAVGAALAAASGMAAADVSWYGKANLVLTDSDVDGAEIDLDGGGSRIGINASEDLGNGITVKYWHEWRLETANGASLCYRGDGSSGSNGAAPNCGQFGHRDNLLSFNGSFGSFGGGDIAAPSKVIGAGKLDMLGDTVADMNGGGLISQPAGQQIRYGNKLGDVSFTIAYGLDGAEDTNWTDGNVIYKSGPLELGLGYHASGDVYHPSFSGDTLVNLVAIYSMDNMKFLAGYESVSDIGAPDSGNDATAFTLGASFGFDANTITVQYTDKDADNDSGATRIGLGWTRDLSKTTSIGATYATNDPQADGADTVNSWDIGASFKF